MRERIDALAKEIKEGYDLLQSKAKQIRLSNPSLICQVKSVQLDLSVCAVDGGLLAHRMHGADIVVVRAVGVNFIYSNSTLKTCSYWPEKNPKPEIFMKSSLDEHEALVFRSLVRLREELLCAVSCLENFSPQVLLMDGSLLPLPTDRPPDESELNVVYNEVLTLYTKLYNLSKGKCILVGVIKDSRSKKLAKEFKLNCSDGIFCNFLLGEMERTNHMPYSDKEHNISVFYVKPSKFDLPLRIETTSTEIDRVASIICSLSSFSENFAYPAVLIEADMCAVLDTKELEPIEDSLNSLSGMKPLRRNSRPFR